MDIRRKTALIIRKDREYLVGRDELFGGLIWNSSPWAAWSTRIRANAKSIQQKVGGEIMLWNPVAGQIRRAEI